MDGGVGEVQGTAVGHGDVGSGFDLMREVGAILLNGSAYLSGVRGR